MCEQSSLPNTSVGNQDDLLKVAGEQYGVLYKRPSIYGEISPDEIETVNAITQTHHYFVANDRVFFF